jgi:L-cysteine:1D-myo-inositol 2-amino-2-deoxy-alpha-D-glucopyranoside ligase
MINRYLRATGADVRYVQNITDIDDPLLERAKRDGIDWEDLAHSHIELFRSDMVNLHILPPESYIGAVEAIPLVTKAIEVLKAANTIYSVDDDLSELVDNFNKPHAICSMCSKDKQAASIDHYGPDAVLEKREIKWVN